jgi:hypothetical protein
VNELGKAAIIVHLGNESTFAKNLVHIDRMSELEPPGNKNVGIHGSCSGNFKRIFKVVAIKLLTPTSYQNDMLENPSVLQVFEYGVEYFKFCVHEGPF